jgi:hypothetical protein
MKVRDEKGWNWANELTSRPVSYSYCPECLEEFRHDAGFARPAPALATAYA